MYGQTRVLTELVAKMAVACVRDGVPLDDTPNGAIHRWVMAHVEYREDTVFFIVFLIACEMGRISRGEVELE